MGKKLPAGIMPDPKAHMPDLLLRNAGKWVRHEGMRPGVYLHSSSTGERCITVRAQLPPGGFLSAESCRRMADLVDLYAQGCRRTSRGSLEFLGVDPENVERLISALEELGYPIGGTGRALHQIKCCAGFAHCQNAAIDAPSIAKVIGDHFFNELYRQEYPSWIKISIGGCPNQCGCGVEADIGVLGVFKGIPQVNDALLAESGCDIPLLCSWCPTGAIKPRPMRGGMSIDILADRCVRCTSCSNVCPTAIQMSGQRGAALAIGGLSGNGGGGPRLARIFIPFIPLNTPLEYEPLTQVIGRIIEEWRCGARPGERLGSYVERIGWPAFIRRVGAEFDPYIIDNFSPTSIRRNLRLRWACGNERQK